MEKEVGPLHKVHRRGRLSTCLVTSLVLIRLCNCEEPGYRFRAQDRVYARGPRRWLHGLAFLFAVHAIVVTQRLLQLRIERLKGEAWEFKHLARTLLEKCKKTLNLHHIKRTDPGEPIA
jgi:hypothetical protein